MRWGQDAGSGPSPNQGGGGTLAQLINACICQFIINYFSTICQTKHKNVTTKYVYPDPRLDFHAPLRSTQVAVVPCHSLVRIDPSTQKGYAFYRHNVHSSITLRLCYMFITSIELIHLLHFNMKLQISSNIFDANPFHGSVIRKYIYFQFKDTFVISMMCEFAS